MYLHLAARRAAERAANALQPGQAVAVWLGQAVHHQVLGDVALVALALSEEGAEVSPQEPPSRDPLYYSMIYYTILYYTILYYTILSCARTHTHTPHTLVCARRGLCARGPCGRRPADRAWCPAADQRGSAGSGRHARSPRDKQRVRQNTYTYKLLFTRQTTRKLAARRDPRMTEASAP